MGSTKEVSAPPPPQPMITRMPNEADFESGVEERRKLTQNRQGRRKNYKKKPFVYENVMGVGKTLGDTAPTSRGKTVFNMDNY